MATFNGTEGDDTLIGGSAADDLNGFGGNDFLQGGDGADVVLGYAGNDTMSGNAGDDWVRGGTGNDQVTGGSGRDSFAFADFGAANADLMTDFASSWDNIQLDASVFGALGTTGRFAAGDARFFAGSAAHDADDRIIYNSATGQLWYDADGTGATAAQLIATLPGGTALVASDIYAFGAAPGQVINGTPGADSLSGGSGPDTISGLGGADTINGNDGNDLIDGGSGNNWLVGGAGADTFSFTTAPAHPSNSNFMADFVPGTDRMQLDGNAFANIGPAGPFSAGDERFWASADGTAHDSTDRIIYNTSNGILTFDYDGNGPGTAQIFANFQNAPAISSTDFSVVNSTPNLLITGTPANDTLIGGAGNDTIQGLDGMDSIQGLGGNDWLSGDGDRDWIEGNEGADTLIGGDGNDSLVGGPGADNLQGGLGSDSYYVDGEDFVGADPGGDSDGIFTEVSWGTLPSGFEYLVLLEGSAARSGNGNEGNNTLFGNSGDNFLGGLDGNDWLDGGGGSDTLDGGFGRDTLVGSAGADILRMSVAPDGVTYDQINDFSSGTDTIQLDGRSTAFFSIGPSGDFSATDPRFHVGWDGIDSQVRIIYDPSSGFLYFDADGNGSSYGARAFAWVIDRAPVTASDFNVINGTDPGQSIDGTPGNDSLVGGSGPDTINGFAGNDTIDGSGGADSMIGGSGDDLYLVDNSSDTIVELQNEGIDEVRSTVAYQLPDWVNNLTLAGGATSGVGNAIENLITGSSGNNLLFGMAGNDTLRGLDGFDSLLGGAGNDSMTGDAGQDIFYFGGDDGANYGQDTVDGGTGIDWIDFTGSGITGAIAADMRTGSLTGGGAAGSVAFANVEKIQGTSFDDRIVGDAAANWLSGGAGGSDTLDGGLGNDTLSGFSGVDHFVFTSAAGAANSDTITDFTSGEDKIHLDGSAFPIGGSGNFTADDPRFFSTDGAVNGHDADDRIIYSTVTRALYYDADGSGSGVAQIIASIQNGGTIAATDIVVDNGVTPSPTPSPTPTPTPAPIPAGSIVGTAGNDNMSGTAGNDTIFGLAGNDTIFANGGNDWVQGGAGNDQVSGGSGQDIYAFAEYGSANADTVANFGSGWDAIRLDAASFSNIGATGRFAGGDVRFFAAAGATSAHDADDRIVYDTSNGQLFYDADGAGGAAAELIGTFTGAPGMAATDITVFGTAGTPSPTPSPTPTPTPAPTGGTSQSGTAGNDTLVGTSGNDTIFGNSGNDWIEGGAGNDQLSGGSGMDSYVFREFGAGNADRLANFDGNNWDSLRFDNAAFTALGAHGRIAAGDGRFWAAAGATGGHDADDRIVYNTSTGQLYYDADGSGAGGAELVATIQGAPAVTAPDIWVI